MPDQAKSTKGSNSPTQTILTPKPKKPKPKIQRGLQVELGDPTILLIAPHGVMGDDDRTDIVAFEAQQQLDCYAIINRKVKRNKYDLNLFKSASNHPTFIKKLTEAVYKPKFKLAVWIHGGDEKGEKWEGAIEANEFECEPQDINAFIGYGQGRKPNLPKIKPNDRPTAKEETVEALCKHLTEAGLVAVKTGRGAPSYRAHHPDNMCQWLKKQGFSLGKAESIQIEIRKSGFRDSDENARKTATILTQALVQLFPHYAEKRDTNLAEQAYQKLSGLFKRHITAFMLEAGKYIIDNFYGGNARLALAKNKSPENPPSLNLLIKKLKAAPNSPSENAPSVSWFYKAVNMAAHEAIFKQMGLSAFTILGHSHKLQLLNFPPLKQIDGDKFDEEIEPNFIKKEQFARHAIDEGLTVRAFKKYLDNECPSGKINLLDLPPHEELLPLGPDKLNELRKEAERKIEAGKKLIEDYTGVLNNLKSVLAGLKTVDAIAESKKKKKFVWQKSPITTNSGETKNVTAPVIISATRRSDIPACEAGKFMEALRDRQIRYNHYGNWIDVSLEKTRFIVFWTKNPRPMMFQHLDEIENQLGLGYYFLYTINDYEQEGLESGPDLPPLQERIDTFKELAGRIGKERLIWRFDPLILTNKISKQALIDKVGSVMTQLAGHTEKLVFSFLNPNKYGARNNLKAVGHGVRAFSDNEKAYISWHLSEMATEHGMQAATCADPLDLLEYDVKPNKCVDYDLIRRISGQDKVLMQFLDKAEGLEYSTGREHCDCSPAYDIGIENTCQNGCVYCYANDSEEALQNQLKRIETDEAALAASTSVDVKSVISLEKTVHQVNESIKIVNADFSSWCNDNLEPDSVDLILTDPPYPKKYLYLWKQLAEVAARVLKPNGYLVTYSGIYHLNTVLDLMRGHLTYCTTYSLLHNGRRTFVHARKIWNQWKPILIYIKGSIDNFDKEPDIAILNDKPDKKYHKWGQGEPAVQYLMNAFSEPNDLVLEPFAGGGTTLAVANKLGRKCIGIEKDPKFIDVIKERIMTVSTPAEPVPAELN